MNTRQRWAATFATQSALASAPGNSQAYTCSMNHWCDGSKFQYIPSLIDVSDQRINLQDELTSYKCSQTSTTNIYQIKWTMEDEVISDSHPIATHGLGEGRLWILKRYKLFDIPQTQ